MRGDILFLINIDGLTTINNLLY